LFEQAFAGLAPGGFLELQDTDCPGLSQDSSLEGTALAKWYENILKGANIMGQDLEISKRYKGWMEEVGFVNVEEKRFCWPINVSKLSFSVCFQLKDSIQGKLTQLHPQTWPKDPHLKKLGFWFQQDLLEVITAFKQPLIRGLGWTLEGVEKFQVEVKKDVIDRKIHAYQVM
jgi:hypothetical protein